MRYITIEKGSLQISMADILLLGFKQKKLACVYAY